MEVAVCQYILILYNIYYCKIENSGLYLWQRERTRLLFLISSAPPVNANSTLPPVVLSGEYNMTTDFY